jgi:hypothetical protein
MPAGEEWTAWRSRGTTTAPQQSQPPDSVDADAGSPHTGLACLAADLCRALGRVAAHPSAVSAPLGRRSGGEEAGVRQSRADGGPRVPRSALRPGHAPGGDAVQVVAVLTVCPSLCGQLGQSGKPGPPRRPPLSAAHPHGTGHVPHHLLPACGDGLACVHALRGAMAGGFV